MSRADDAASTDAVKVIYVVRRKPEVDPGAFVRRWREHGALAMAQHRWRNVRRYVHCDIVGEYDRAGHLRATALGGFGMSWYRSAAHRADHVADRQAQGTMAADEREAFAQLVAGTCAETILAGATAVPQVKIIRLVTRGPVASGSDFGTAWRAASDVVVHEHPGVIVRYVCNTWLAPGSLVEPLRCDLLEEFGFASAESRASFVEERGQEFLAPPDPRPATVRSFATNEVVLHDIHAGDDRSPR